MKRLIVFLVTLLVMPNINLAMSVTIAQADSIIQTASASTSASNLFSLLGGLLSDNMTLVNFSGYYNPNFVSNFTQTEYQQLLNDYLTDVAGSNYIQAEIDLIKLAAATFKNGNRVVTLLQVPVDPWGSGSKFFVPGSPLNQFYLQFFVNQFAKVHAKLSTGTSPANQSPANQGDTVPPLNAATKFADPSGMMLLEQTNDEGIMDSIASTGVANLSGAAQDVANSLNGIQAQAMADSNIGDAATKQNYLTQLNTAVINGVSSLSNPNSLQSLANNLNQQISAAKTTGVSNLNLLVSQGGNASIAAAYISNLNNRAITDQGQINTALNSAISTINSLEQTIETAINDQNSDNSGSGIIGVKVLDDLLDGVGASLTAAGLGVLVYCRKLILCKFGIGVCPPELDVPEVKAITDTFGGTLNGLLSKLNSPTTTAMLEKFSFLRTQVVSELSNSLGLSSDDIMSLIGTPSTPGNDLVNFMQKISNIHKSVMEAMPDADATQVYVKIGTVLQSNPEISDINALSYKVQVALGGGNIINTGTGQVNIPGAEAFNDLEYTSAEQFKASLFEQIKTIQLTQAQFETQMSSLRAALAEVEQDSEEAELLNNEISAAQEIISEANGKGGSDPFDPDL